jgi:hypothetical protein
MDPYRYRLYYIFILGLSFVPLCYASELAWNGHTPPGSKTKTRLTPYYVPPGAKSYDSKSPFVFYYGPWNNSVSSAYVGGSIRTSISLDAEVRFPFTGTGIEWFGNMGRKQGRALVYIDGKLIQTVNAYENVEEQECQRKFYKYDLAPGRHILRITNVHAQLDIDAFVVTDTSPKSAPGSTHAPSNPAL